jgi:hypothetical protein
MVVHTCNPSYEEGRAQDHCSSKLAQAKKKVSMTHISTNKLGMVVHVCYSSYERGIGRGDHGPRPAPDQKVWDTIQKITKAKMAGGRA